MSRTALSRLIGFWRGALVRYMTTPKISKVNAQGADHRRATDELRDLHRFAHQLGAPQVQAADATISSDGQKVVLFFSHSDFQTHVSATLPRHRAETSTRCSGSPKNWLRAHSTGSCVTQPQPLTPQGSRVSAWTGSCYELTPKPGPCQRTSCHRRRLGRATLPRTQGPDAFYLPAHPARIR